MLQVHRTRKVGLGSSGDLHEVAQSGCSRMGAAAARGAGAWFFGRPVLLVEVGAEVSDVAAVTPDTPPLLLPHALVAQGLELRFHLAMMFHLPRGFPRTRGQLPPGAKSGGSPSPSPAPA